MSGGLPIWVIYDHPKDYPREFVARKWIGTAPTAEVMVALTLGALREALAEKGLVRLERYDEDDAAIVETWL